VGLVVTSDAEGRARLGLGAEVRGRRRDARRTFEEQARDWRVDVAEVVAHVELCDIADGSSQLTPVDRADDDKVEEVPAVLDHLSLGEFKGEEDAAADLEGVSMVLSGGKGAQSSRPK